MCYPCSLIGLTSCDCDNAIEAGLCSLGNVYCLMSMSVLSWSVTHINFLTVEQRSEGMNEWQAGSWLVVSWFPRRVVDAASDSAGTS